MKNAIKPIAAAAVIALATTAHADVVSPLYDSNTGVLELVSTDGYITGTSGIASTQSVQNVAAQAQAFTVGAIGVAEQQAIAEAAQYVSIGGVTAAAAAVIGSNAQWGGMALGAGASAGTESVAVGSGLGGQGSTAGNFGTAVGGSESGWGTDGKARMNVAGMYGSAYGFASQAQGRGDTAIGAYANTGSASPLGASDDSQDSYRTAVGYKSSATGEASVAVGGFNSATGASSVALGFGSIADQDNTVSVGSASNQRRITNVAAGTYATDAVNYGQLLGVQSALQTQITAISTADAANSAAVAAAQASAAAASSSTASETSRATSAEQTLQAAMVQGNALTLQSANDFASTASAQALQQANSYTDQKFGQAESDIHALREDMYGGVASALAVAGLPQPTAPGRSMVSAATSNYHGFQGFAAGYSYVTPNDKVVVKASVTTSTRGDVGAVVGAGYQW